MRFREKARQPNARYIGPRGEPGQFKGKKKKRPAKGESIKGRLSTRLIFRATPLYQDHVCYSPLGTNSGENSCVVFLRRAVVSR